MKRYVAFSCAQEFDIHEELELYDDGRFSYGESWSCYGAALGGSAQGIWRESGGALDFRCERSGGTMQNEWTEGETKRALERGDELDFGNFKMTFIPERPDAKKAESPKSEENPAPQSEIQKEKSSPRIARLHFKDGSIVEKQLPGDSMLGLFSEVYYRLVDEQGNETNIFQPRADSENTNAQVVEFDEI